jgi:hypothetical protein
VNHAPKVPKDAEIINSIEHKDTANISYSLTLIEVLAETLDLDATKVNLHIDDYVCTSLLDERYRKRCDETNCLCVAFNYGDYLIKCCLCGYIAIASNKRDYHNGTVKLPRSMNSYSQNQSRGRACDD